MRIEKPWGAVADQSQFFQIAVTGLQGERVVASAKIEARNIERYAGADAGASLGIGTAAGLSGLHLKSKAVIECVAPRFRELEIRLSY